MDVLHVLLKADAFARLAALAEALDLAPGARGDSCCFLRAAWKCQCEKGRTEGRGMP